MCTPPYCLTKQEYVPHGDEIQIFGRKPSPLVLSQTGENRRHRFWGQTGENRPSGFDVKPLTNHCHRFWGKSRENHPSDFEVKPLKNRRPWFWGSIKKHALLVSSCTVQITHSITQHPNRPVIEYLTYATIIDPLHQVYYSCHDPHRYPPCRTCHLHITRQSNTILHTNKIKIVESPKYPWFEFKP
jgi:hypothetical protein